GCRGAAARVQVLKQRRCGREQRRRVEAIAPDGMFETHRRMRRGLEWIIDVGGIVRRVAELKGGRVHRRRTQHISSSNGQCGDEVSAPGEARGEDALAVNAVAGFDLFEHVVEVNYVM